MTGYTVETWALRQHSNKLAGIKSDVAAASSAGLTTSLGSDAFGLVCSFLYPDAARVQTQCVDNFDAVADSLDGLADAIRAIADSYDQVDREVSAGFSKVLANAPVV